MIRVLPGGGGGLAAEWPREAPPPRPVHAHREPGPGLSFWELTGSWASASHYQVHRPLKPRAHVRARTLAHPRHCPGLSAGLWTSRHPGPGSQRCRRAPARAAGSALAAGPSSGFTSSAVPRAHRVPPGPCEVCAGLARVLSLHSAPLTIRGMCAGPPRAAARLSLIWGALT